MKEENINIRIDQELKAKFKNLAEIDGRTLSNWLIELGKRELMLTEYKENKTWYVSLPGNRQDLKIVGRTLQEAVHNRINDLVYYDGREFEYVKSVLGYNLEYDEYKSGCQVVLRFVVEVTKTNDHTGPSWKSERTLGIYADEHFNPTK
jgi:hypothetical protein